MMCRAIYSLLVVLLVFAGVTQHGQSAGTAGLSADHVVASISHPGDKGGHEHGSPGETSRHDMTDACAIVCVGTSTPWLAAAQLAPVETEHSLKWHSISETREGLLVGPGYRPPKSI
jgi:hypothetical protein